jgi:UDP-glucuronate 4-epimerase
LSKSILVTGAAGFIGSHVTQTLLLRGDRVIGLDNLNNYYDPTRKRANLEEILLDPSCASRFRFFEGDVRDRELLAQIFDDRGVDAVVHLAAMPGVRASMDAPSLYYDVNLIGSLNLLDLARDYNLANFVLASTSSVYGSTKTIPFVETDPCDRPLAPYPASKRSAEMLAFTYHHLYGLNITVLRFFTVYGPRCRPDMMSYKILDNIFFGRQVPLYNNGLMYRDWTYVGDIVSGVAAAVDKPLGYEEVNLGRGEPILLADFVRITEELAGEKTNLDPSPMPSADMERTYADIGKARNLLDYDPRVSVQEGVSRFWDWYRQTVLEPST